MIEEQGEAIGRLLLKYFKEDLSQRPAFQLGLSSLRRSELHVLADKIGEAHAPGLSKAQILPIMNAWLAEGKFDHLQPPTAAGMASQMEDLVKDNERLNIQAKADRERMDSMEAVLRRFVNAGSSGAAMSELRAFVGAGEVTAERIDGGPVDATVDTSFGGVYTKEIIQGLGWNDVRRLAKRHGVADPKKKREQLEEELTAILVGKEVAPDFGADDDPEEEFDPATGETVPPPPPVDGFPDPKE